MDNYNEYKTTELLELLEYLEEEDKPTFKLILLKNEIRRIAAKKLKVDVQDVVKLCMKKKKKQEELRMKRHYFETRMRLAVDKLQIRINQVNEKIDKIINEKNDDILI